MFSSHVYCYPWDLLDEGVPQVLDRLQGQVGIDGVVLLAAGDEIQQFRPHQDAEPKIYRTTGGVFFQPTESLYHATSLKPPLWDRCRKTDVLGNICEQCAGRGLDVRLSVSPFHSRRLVSKHPQVACKNVYGIGSRHALCPANPDVLAYLVSMVRDLAQFADASAVVIEEVQWPIATDLIPHLDAAGTLGLDVSVLLEICFCESCVRLAQAADIDLDGARRTVRALVDRRCQEGQAAGATPTEVVAENPILGDVLAWREVALLAVLERLKEGAGAALCLDFRSASSGLLDLGHAAGLLSLADRVFIDLDDLEQTILQISQEESGAIALTPTAVQSMELLLRLDEGAIDEAPEVVRQITWAAEAGAGGVVMMHYGAILNSQFDWLHQGLRHARRLLGS